jgi:tetratricopeptide (TPR) repeat protein
VRHTTVWLASALAVCAACAQPSATDRAQTLVRQHRDDEAVATLRERLRTTPDDLAARGLLVRLLGLTGNLPGAREQAEELARRLPEGDPTAHLELGHAYELAHDFDAALEQYDEAAAASPGSPVGPREGGLRAARWGEVEAARPRLEEAVRRGASDAETWHALGLVRLSTGELDAAEQAYRAGAAADPKGAECWLGLATVALIRGDAQGALAAYDGVLARRPKFAPAELGRAWALAKLGRREEARRALDHAEELGAPAQNVARQRAALGAP